MKKIIISQKIKDYRRKNSLTQEDFGKLIGVSAQAISKWERCECYPDIIFLPDIAELLSCSINDFFVSDDFS
ncbi:MAG: helix-turn-helix domain-containing protein [Ruminococcaceae bacterium]|nr:helix-turn-helix domain-containing protein [Oscillospiraceae bacterium]